MPPLEEVESYSLTPWRTTVRPAPWELVRKPALYDLAILSAQGVKPKLPGNSSELGTVNPPDSATNEFAWYSGRYGS